MKNVNIRLYIAPVVAVLLCHGSALAQIMNDPTQPPGATSLGEPETEQARAPVLQSVIITPSHRAAIINGERVELGGKYRDARVLKITETEVVLRSAGRTEVLKMYPNVDKAVRRTEPVRMPSSPLRDRSTKG